MARSQTSRLEWSWMETVRGVACGVAVGLVEVWLCRFRCGGWWWQEVTVGLWWVPEMV